MDDRSFIAYIEDSIKTNWDVAALTDYQGGTLQYKDVARKIEKLHIMFEHVGVKPGDKIALCGRNSANWTVVYLGILTYGAVVVPILHDFKPDTIHHIVNHSDASLLFAGDWVWPKLDAEAMPALKGVLMIHDFSVVVSRSEQLTYAREHLNELFGKKYPKYFRATHVAYRHEESEDELALISYTSGTTSFSKGVMLPYRSLWGNIDFAINALPMKAGDNLLCMLPLAHAFGMAFEFLFPFCMGCHIYFLSRTPSPAIVLQALKEIKPRLILSVPLVIEKIIRKQVFPKLERQSSKFLLVMPMISEKIYRSIRQKLIDTFGGNFIELVIGGAPLNAEVEAFLKKIRFPYTVGYGMTECGPLISYANWRSYKEGSCGRPISHMNVRIDSSSPSTIPGEVQVKGVNTFLGYYKNEDDTRNAFTGDGWMRTGDLATMDAAGNISIKGRCKNMILGPSGQNIYPEEIEDKLNNLPLVEECLVVERDKKIVALVYPNLDECKVLGLDEAGIRTAMEENRKQVNQLLPAYSSVAEIEVRSEEFEKTPKRSIKRYLYQ